MLDIFGPARLFMHPDQIFLYRLYIFHIPSAVVPSLSVVKARIVNGSSDGNDETRVKDTNPSDSTAEVLLFNN